MGCWLAAGSCCWRSSEGGEAATVAWVEKKRQLNNTETIKQHEMGEPDHMRSGKPEQEEPDKYEKWKPRHETWGAETIRQYAVEMRMFTEHHMVVTSHSYCCCQLQTNPCYVLLTASVGERLPFLPSSVVPELLSSDPEADCERHER